MYDTHGGLYKFYDKYVRLSAEVQGELTDYRDKNVERLRKGLKELSYGLPLRSCNQGSYAMYTMVQRDNNDYDIDLAVIFAKEDLPSDAYKARKRVLAGIEKGGGNFKEPPEARKNAVTVWYQEGYHIDLPVYREYEDEFGNIVIEHAGIEWTRRDPMEITNWFLNEVAVKSPKKDNGATVPDGQMRRIVQYLKMFAKSRSGWKLPGGLLISVLVSECYMSDAARDDIALYNTMGAIYNRLKLYTDIYNPINPDPSLKLTDTTEHTNEVIRFKDKLEQALEWLSPLCDPKCDELAAYKAWNNVFTHDYWVELMNGLQLVAAKSTYIGATGKVYSEKPEGRSIQSPPHRFFGGE